MMTKFIPNDQEKVVEDAAIRNKRNEAINPPTPRNKTQTLREASGGERAIRITLGWVIDRYFTPMAQWATPSYSNAKTSDVK